MATVDTTVNNLVINKLTQAQYDALTEKSPTELYFVTDAQEPLQVVDAVENFPACTVEDLGKLVIYTGPTTESTQESVQLVLDGTIYNGHIFGCIEVNVMMSENESVAYYMWKDVYESLPTIGDNVAGKVLSNNGLYPEWVDMPEGGSGSSSQVNELPDASLNVGNVVQYVGESTDTLTNGYFYKAEQVDPLTAEITNFDSYEYNTVSVEVGDFNLFVEKFGNAYGTYILTVDDMLTFVLQKPDGTRNGSAPISYGINITIDGELQTTYNAPLAAATGNLEITIVYNASGGFVWKNIEVQKVNIKKELPSLSSGADKFLMTDGVDLYWYDAITPSDYAMKSKAGLIRPSSTYGTTMTGVQYLAAEVKTPAQYEAANNQMFVSKGTLDNVLESYMLVPTSPTDDGTYVLKATVVDGVVTTEWVLEA